MASKSDIKGFYKQQKRGGISKSKSKSKTASSSTPKHSASFGADVTQPPALVSHGSLDLQGISLHHYPNLDLNKPFQYTHIHIVENPNGRAGYDFLGRDYKLYLVH